MNELSARKTGYSITRLNYSCKVCGERADFETSEPNSNLPEYSPEGLKYIKTGIRFSCYCTKHLPVEFKRFWDENNTLYD